jgi:hypothetical protein
MSGAKRGRNYGLEMRPVIAARYCSNYREFSAGVDKGTAWRLQLITKAVAKSSRTEEKTLGAQIRQMGCLLDKGLRRQLQALSQRQRFCGAFCKHRRRFLDFNEVGSHGRYAGRMQIQKLFVIHSGHLFN